MDKETEIASDDGLSAEEQAFFNSRGEKPIETKKAEEQAPSDGGEQDGASKQAATAGEGEGDKPAESGDDDGDEGRPVNYGALKRERIKRKELEERLAAVQKASSEKEQLFERRFAAIAGHLQGQRQAAPQQAPGQTQAQPEQPAIPTVDEDFMGAVKWTQEELLALRKEREQSKQNQERTQQVNQAKQRVYNTYRAKAAEAAQVDANFTPAYNYLVDSEVRALMARGYSQDEAVRAAAEGELEMARDVMNAGRHPARVIMDMAYARGWRPEAPQREQPPAEQSAERLKTIAEGQNANKTLSGAGTGGAATGKLSAQALLEMSEDEFAAVLGKKGGQKAFRAAVGGA